MQQVISFWRRPRTWEPIASTVGMHIETRYVRLRFATISESVSGVPVNHRVGDVCEFKMLKRPHKLRIDKEWLKANAPAATLPTAQEGLTAVALRNVMLNLSAGCERESRVLVLRAQP